MIRRYWLDFWKSLGYALPSSYFLAKRLVSTVDFTDAKLIIELGGGGGVVTKEILSLISPNTALHVFEIDPLQSEKLTEMFRKYPHVTIHQESAANIEALFEKGSVDIIVSTLPLGSIPISIVHEVLRSAHAVLRDAGQYIQYQFWMANRKDVKQYFHIEKTYLELRNYGPAFIYRSKKK